MEAIDMPNLSIKNVPEALAERLRQRAALNHRSLQGELMAIIQQAVDGQAAESQPTGAATNAAAAPRMRPAAGSKTIAQIAAEHRARHPVPLAASPRAVDILRTERDGR
jgi:plasmid stability protein